MHLCLIANPIEKSFFPTHAKKPWQRLDEFALLADATSFLCSSVHHSQPCSHPVLSF